MSIVLIHDTKLTVKNPNEMVAYEWEKPVKGGFWDTFRATMDFLGSLGFYVGEDKEVKKHFPILNWKNKKGRYMNLEFKAEFHQACIELEFFQNVVYENPHGGQYDFEKRKKMPYLIGLQYEITLKKLEAFFEEKGFEIRYGNNIFKGEDFIVEDYIRCWHHPQETKFKLSDINGLPDDNGQGSNGKNREGRQLLNGEIQYFRDYSGYLCRGKVYHNINNMWWVLQVDGTVANKASFELFDLQETDVRKRLKVKMLPKEYAERKKQLSLCSTKEIENELKRRKKCMKKAAHP